MSHNDERIAKKIKREVSNYQRIHHVKDENVPVIFTDYGSQCNNKYNALVYLRAPERQINPIENKQLHKGVHRHMKSNASYFELLPNELIQDLFVYLSIMDICRSFYYLNQRFHQLVQLAHLQLDFSSLSLREFDFICSQFNPKQVEALTLGNCDVNRVNEPSSFGQIALFLYRYHLSQFTSLKSLRIIEPYDDKQLIVLLNQLSQNQLKHLRIGFSTRSQEDLLFCLPFIDTIESISLDQVTLTDLTKFSPMSFKQLQYLSINDISEAFLLSLLSGMSRLRYLKVRLVSNPDYMEICFTSQNKFELLDLTILYVESIETSWKAIELNLLSLMPNLRRLSLVGDYKTPVVLLAEQWKEGFLTYTPHLTDFRFYVNISSTNRSLYIDEILKPFQEEFWRERKWYVAVDVREEKNVHLYSLPCPRLYQPLKIITYVKHRLTTFPVTSKIDHRYYNSTTFLDASCIDKDTRTSSTDVLYSKVHSLIIGRNDCDIILHRLIRVSSIRELTLVNNTNPIRFINLLNMLTRLESLRLLEGSDRILLSLKENISLFQCLQKHAIRKLFLKNYYGADELIDKSVFPINEFIQIFSNSLESLYWMKPPISLLIYSLINDLPKLKSLTTAWRPNTVFSTYELIQWIQKNTRLNTFVMKCENSGGNVIWYFWL